MYLEVVWALTRDLLPRPGAVSSRNMRIPYLRLRPMRRNALSAE